MNQLNNSVLQINIIQSKSSRNTHISGIDSPPPGEIRPPCPIRKASLLAKGTGHCWATPAGPRPVAPLLGIASPCPLPSPVKPNPCPALPHPVDMLETTVHLWGKTETEPREKINIFEESPLVRNLLSLTC